MANMQAPWMRVADALQGEAEIAGALANPRIIEMFKVSGCPDTPEFRSDETAWCAAFANSCLRLSGYMGTNSALAASFAEFGVDLGQTPQYGCIVLFWPLAGTGSGHVGFFVGQKGQNIQVLGGNQSDEVKVSNFSKGKWRAFRWPSETAPIPEEHMLPTILTLAPQEAPDHTRAPTKPLPTPTALAVPVPADNFSRVQPIIDHWEGGYSDHPQDPGGATNMGITQETLKRWRKHDVGKEDVKNLQRDEAWEIYRAFYWAPLRCDEMPIADALITYNAGVMSGPGRGARWLQQSLNKQGADLKIDGTVGPLTLDACSRFDVTRAVQDFATIQESFLRGLDTFATFGSGWINRLSDIKSKALDMASEPVLVVDRAPPAEPLESSLLSLLKKLTAVLKENAMVATTIPSPQATKAGDTQRAANIAAILADVASVLANQKIAAPAEAAPTIAAEVPTPTSPAPPTLSSIDQFLGGQALAGKKTLIGVVAYVILVILQATGVVGTATGPEATPTGEILTTLIASFAGLGVVSKVDRVVQALSTIANKLPRSKVSLPPPT